MRTLQIRDIRQKHFFVINDEYLNGYAKIAKPTATAIYNSLCRHADTNQSSFPSVGLLAREHGISISTAQRAIRKLVSLKIISKERVRNPKGKWLNNIYYLLDKSVWITKPTGQKQPMGIHRSKTSKTTGQNRTTKDTHKKDTHTTSGGGGDNFIERVTRWAYERAYNTPNCSPDSFKRSVGEAVERAGVEKVDRVFSDSDNAIRFLVDIKGLG